MFHDNTLTGVQKEQAQNNNTLEARNQAAALCLAAKHSDEIVSLISIINSFDSHVCDCIGMNAAQL